MSDGRRRRTGERSHPGDVSGGLPGARALAAAVGTAPGDTDLLSPWLYSIATNRALTLLRRQATLRRIQPQTPAVEEESASIEDAVVGRTLLRAALETLDDESAACLVLHYVAGERYGEIAARLNLSSEAVRKRVGRALAALRRVYAAMESEAAQ